MIITLKSFIVSVIIMITGLSCSNRNSDSSFDSNSISNQEQKKQIESPINDSHTEISNKLSPQEWLEKYNAAWTDCNKQVPLVVTENSNSLTNEQCINLCNERGQKITELLKQQYPELYEYLNLSEYQEVLMNQGQNYYNNILIQGQIEIDREREEIRQQSIRDQRDLDLQKERNEMFLNNNPPPQYGQ